MLKYSQVFYRVSRNWRIIRTCTTVRNYPETSSFRTNSNEDNFIQRAQLFSYLLADKLICANLNKNDFRTGEYSLEDEPISH